MGKLNDAYEELKRAGLTMKHLEIYSRQQGKVTEADDRYNVPKEEPKVSEELINKTIEETEIYRKAKFYILEAQKRQVGYGLEKYPNPLNANTWSAIETIDHILEESIDKIHYLIMLRIKLEQEIVKNNHAVESIEKTLSETTDPFGYTINGADIDGDSLDAARYSYALRHLPPSDKENK